MNRVHAVTDSAELQLAKHLLARMAQRGTLDAAPIQTWSHPSQPICGATVAAVRTPGNALNVMVTEPSGQGLAAVITALPMIDAFYSMCEKGFPLAGIVRELNRKAHFLLPADRFLAATLLSINFVEKVIQVWNGAAPTRYYITERGDIARAWQAHHPALGVRADQDFDSAAQTYCWQETGTLMLFSDSLPHAKNAEGNALGMSRIMQQARQVGEPSPFHALVTLVQQHIHATSQDHDLSIIGIHCNAAAPWRNDHRNGDFFTPAPATGDFCWRLHLALGAAQIRRIDTLPWVMNWLDQIHIPPLHRGQAFVVIGELFNNALDHGLLELDSDLKQAPAGFESYLEARAARLAALDDASIELDLECFNADGKHCLRITVRDSGPGFDHAATRNRFEADPDQFSGRGLMLVRRLCHSLEYAARGNEVTALYVLDESRA